MFSLSISFGPVGTMWRLLFKTEESAKAAIEKLRKPPLNEMVMGSGVAASGMASLTDDFGQTVELRTDRLNAFMLEDMAQSKLATVEATMHDWRTRAACQTAASADPLLKAAAMMTPRGGPPVLGQVPGMNGGY